MSQCSNSGIEKRFGLTSTDIIRRMGLETDYKETLFIEDQNDMITEAIKAKLNLICEKRQDFLPIAQEIMAKDKPVTKSRELLRDVQWGDSRPADYAANKLVIDMLRELEKAGLGRLVIGRKGKETRFNWNLIATNGTPRREEAGSPNLGDSHSTNPNTITHTFVLRHDFVAKIELPKDLSRREAERLAGYVVTLPLDN